MDNTKIVLQKINHLITTIESYYPEIYQFLDELPSSVPSTPTDVNKTALIEYYESLKELLKHHVKKRSMN